MPRFTFDKSISLGNLVSWIIMIVGLSMGYQKLQSNTEQQARDIRDSKTAIANAAEQQIQIRIEAEGTKVKVVNIETKLNEVSNKIDRVLAQTR